MTPERWKRIEKLYNTASALSPDERGALLATACPDDDSLRREVEALLNEPMADDGFLAPRALATAAAQLVSDLAPEANVGRTMGSYVLQRLLGVGGMGVVYAARDTKLERDVAIKILPHAFTTKPDRLARFEREARMLAAVNHPNICAIYGLEGTDGIRYLVLELVDGQTLADIVQRDVESGSRSGLEIPDALLIGRQIVDALEAAHERAIIHRDLKPANIKITSAGVVKVLDFGLAKVTDDAPPPAGGTRDGLILGTAAYMSPEQARGKVVDKRADIWAFGCILYEMLTGRLAFRGETDSDVIGKILEREPDWSALPAATPAAIRRLLLRCLAKDPKQRLRDIGDVRIEIDRIDDVLPGASNDAAPRRATTLWKWLPWAAVAAAVAVVAVSEVRRPALLDNPLANARFSQVTWDGDVSYAEISPDGKWVAFLSDRAGQMDLWLSQLDTGRIRNLTEGISPHPTTGRIVRNVGFNGDSSQVRFGLPHGEGRLMSLIGGSSQPFLGRNDSVPSWSTDARIVYFNASAGDPLFVADRNGADARRIVVNQDENGALFFGPGMHNHNPIWSSDNQWIYFGHGTDPTDDMDVWRVRPSGGSPEQMTDQHADINFLAPLDARTLLYVARAKDRTGPWLWALDVERKLTRRVTTGLEQYTTVSASRDGRRVVATVANPTATLWQVPLLDRLAEDRDVRPYQLPSARAFAPRFGGTSLFYLSGRGTGDGLWRFQEGQTSEVWKGADVALSEPPAVSPDGTRVAVIVRQGGKRHLTIMSADGTSIRTLAASIDIQGAAAHGAADWSPDGAWIVVGGSDENGSGLFKIPVNGGEPVRLTDGPASNPVWSPVDNLIVYAGVAVGNMVPILGIRPDGTTVDLPAVQAGIGGSYRFLRNGTGLVYLASPPNLWLLNFSTKTTRQLTRLSNHGGLRTFDITPDGKQIVFDRTRDNSDVVLIEVPK
jgi:serine/threonine protein kinase/Tol biopolymer transport system component